MKFKTLSIENFMAVGKESLSLDNRGLILIQGENKDDTSQNSNGAGKSTIVDALCWALYGQTARGESGDSIVNRTAGKNCCVSITVADGSDEYEIKRHRKYTKKKNVLEVIKNGKEDLTKGTDKLTQELVTQIMGCSYDVFRSSVYAGQDAQIDLPAMTDKFLKQVVEEAAGIDRLQNAHELAKKKLADKTKAFDAIERDRFAEEMTVSESDFHLEQAEKKVKEAEEKREEEVKKFEFRIESKKKKAAALIKEIKAVDHVALQAEYDTIANRVADESWTKKRDALRTMERDADKAVSNKRHELNALKAELAKAKSKITNSEALVGTPCDECGKPHTAEDMKDVIAAAKKQIAEQLPKAKAMTVEVEMLSKALQEKTDALSAHESSVTVTDEEKARRDALKAQLDSYQKSLADAKQIKRDIEEDINALEAAKTAKNEHEDTLKAIKERVAKAKENMSELQTKLDELTKGIRVAEGVVEVYSNTGVRAHILDTVTPYLNARTADYLSQLSDGNLEAIWTTLSSTSKGELREKFNITVTSKTGGDKYNLLSGAEKRKVRLATNMALQDLVSSRASKPLDLYIGDEIDHALDVSGLERLMALLEAKAKTQGTVLVVSHNELSDWIRDSLTIVKEGGYSRFETSGAA